ncbi:hypothetical protein PIB30_075997 [Stylosanthes scabra]|uniref:Uncharacterized protein n=1 Tax=Stylosanthes scabra TaxID=79078 RepID=A0ABU6VP84_9FABA|nr:hypothetical protein [Stylosanthes scabra]
MESVRWAEWAMVRDATIMKSVEPWLTIVDEAERRNTKLLGNLKILNLQKVVLQEEKTEAEQAKVKAEEKGEEIKSLKTRESRILSEVEKLRGMHLPFSKQEPSTNTILTELRVRENEKEKSQIPNFLTLTQTLAVQARNPETPSHHPVASPRQCRCITLRASSPRQHASGRLLDSRRQNRRSPRHSPAPSHRQKPRIVVPSTRLSRTVTPSNYLLSLHTLTEFENISKLL